MIAHGKVIAGIDLAKLKDSDVSVTGTEVRMTLPAPEILLVTLDNEQTKVYDRKVGFLTQGNKDLEAEARKQAEASIRQAACDGKILEEASINAKKQLGVLLSGLGFTQVSVSIPAGVCS